MFENGRPRYWIDWYDRWYLLLLLLLAGVFFAIWKAPSPSPALPGTVVRNPLPFGSGTPRIPDPLPPLAPTTLSSPQNGKGFFQSRLPNAEGQAEPGVLVVMEYAGLDLVWHELGRMPADARGHFQFLLRNFPPGSYRLRARAVTSSGRSNTSGEVMISVAAEPIREVRRRPRN